MFVPETCKYYYVKNTDFVHAEEGKKTGRKYHNVDNW